MNLEIHFSEDPGKEKWKVDIEAGEKTGATPPVLGTKAGSTRLRFGGYSRKNPGIPNFCRKFDWVPEMSPWCQG